MSSIGGLKTFLWELETFYRGIKNRPIDFLLNFPLVIDTYPPLNTLFNTILNTYVALWITRYFCYAKARYRAHLPSAILAPPLRFAPALRAHPCALLRES